MECKQSRAETWSRAVRVGLGVRLRISFPSLKKNELRLSCEGGHLCTVGVVLGSEASSQTPPADSVKMSLPWHRDVPKVELLVVDAQYHLAISQQVQHTYATRAEARHIEPDSTSERREALVSPGSSSPTTCPSDCWPAIASPVVPLKPLDVLQLPAGAELPRPLLLHDHLLPSRTHQHGPLNRAPPAINWLEHCLSSSLPWRPCAAMCSSSSMAASFSPRCSSLACSLSTLTTSFCTSVMRLVATRAFRSLLLALMFWYAQGGSSTRKENVSTRGLCNYHLQPENRIVSQYSLSLVMRCKCRNGHRSSNNSGGKRPEQAQGNPWSGDRVQKLVWQFHRSVENWTLGFGDYWHDFKMRGCRGGHSPQSIHRSLTTDVIGRWPWSTNLGHQPLPTIDHQLNQMAQRWRWCCVGSGMLCVWWLGECGWGSGGGRVAVWWGCVWCRAVLVRVPVVTLQTSLWGRFQRSYGRLFTTDTVVLTTHTNTHHTQTTHHATSYTQQHATRCTHHNNTTTTQQRHTHTQHTHAETQTARWNTTTHGTNNKPATQPHTKPRAKTPGCKSGWQP